VIAYHILCHDNFAQVGKLLGALYSEDDVFLIDIDQGRKKPRIRALKKWLAKDNVHINFDSGIGWGASGILRKTLLGAYRLLEHDSSWQYYVNLSGQDLPLKSNSFIKEHFARHADQGLNYLRCHKGDVVELESLEVDNYHDHTVMWGDRGHTKVYAKPGTINPQVDLYARTFVDVAEAGEDGAVYIGTVDPVLHRYRKAFFSKYPYHVGSNWCSLHRSLVQAMQDDPFAEELYAVLKTTSNPDESFIQTYVMNTDFRDRISKDYGRMILRPGPVPKVKVFNQQDWDALSGSDQLFARKFDTRVDRDIVKRVLEARAEPELYPAQRPFSLRNWIGGGLGPVRKSTFPETVSPQSESASS